jgi:ribosomal protein S18 acetylase RimI-like enzyme
MTVNIRPATAEDIDAIREISERAWHEAHTPIIGRETTEEFLEQHYDSETFHATIDDPERILDVAADEEGVVGFISGGPSEESPGTFNLVRVYVRPDRWGDGIGRQLLEHFERKVSEREQDRITLGVMADNDRAISFYESMGYDRTEEFYDGTIDTNSYVYEKELDT